MISRNLLAPPLRALGLTIPPAVLARADEMMHPFPTPGYEEVQEDEVDVRALRSEGGYHELAEASSSSTTRRVGRLLAACCRTQSSRTNLWKRQWRPTLWPGSFRRSAKRYAVDTGSLRNRATSTVRTTVAPSISC